MFRVVDNLLEALMEGPSWSCPVCTFDNHPAIGSCEMCGTARKQAEVTAEASSSSSLSQNQRHTGTKVDRVQRENEKPTKKPQGSMKSIAKKGGDSKGIKSEIDKGVDEHAKNLQRPGEERKKQQNNRSEGRHQKSEGKKGFNSSTSFSSSGIKDRGSSSSSSSSSLRADIAPFTPKGIDTGASISPPAKFTEKEKLQQSQVPSNVKDRTRCGCQSTVHAFLSSCFLCGRIICEVEGPFNCFNCNAAFVPTITGDEAEAAGYGQDTVHAYRQKDKLMVFDKEHAKRTKVFDAQADYYESSTWLTEEEKEELKARDKKRREKYRPTKKRSKLTLDLVKRRVMEASSSSDELDVGEDDDGDDSMSKRVCDGGSGGDRVHFMGASSTLSAEEGSSDRTYGIRGKSKHHSQHHRSGYIHEEVDIENLKLSEENSKAGNIYRSLMSRLAPWREEKK